MPRDNFSADEACFLLTVTESCADWIVAISEYLHSILARVGAHSSRVGGTVSWNSSRTPLCWLLAGALTPVLTPLPCLGIGIYRWPPMADNVIKSFLADVNNCDISHRFLWASSWPILLFKSLWNISWPSDSVHIAHVRWSTISTSSTEALLPSFLFCHASSNICVQAVIYASFSRL